MACGSNSSRRQPSSPHPPSLRFLCPTRKPRAAFFAPPSVAPIVAWSGGCHCDCDCRPIERAATILLRPPARRPPLPLPAAPAPAPSRVATMTSSAMPALQHLHLPLDSGLDSPLSSLSACSSPLSSPPSSPLSSPASSPSPPPEIMPLSHSARPRPNLSYPSPPASQQTSQSGSPAPDGMDSAAATDKEGPPPAKRRRISKERSTEYLDMRSGDIDPDQRPELDRVLNVLHKRQKIVVIAGAGISVSAGSRSRFIMSLPLPSQLTADDSP